MVMGLRERRTQEVKIGKKDNATNWMTTHNTLPDSIEQIEQGKQRQLSLLDPPFDHSQAARVARLTNKEPKQ